MTWYLLSLIPLVLGVYCFEGNCVQKLKDLEKSLSTWWPTNLDQNRRSLEGAITMNRMSPMQLPKKNAEALPQYKFYTSLFEDLVVQRKRLGVSQDQSLKNLREGLIQDGKFEKKIKAELYAGYWQFFFITMITWSFTLLSLFILKKQLSFSIGLTMLLLQCSGLLLFTSLFLTLKKKMFDQYGEWFFRLYRLRSLLAAGSPIKTCLKESHVLQLFQTKKKQFQPFIGALETSIMRLQKEGTPIQDDLKFCLDELWFTQDCDFELFLKSLSSLKLAIILLFYLGAYFVYLYSFISTFTKG
ncbi:MAG: hypothetical protein ACOYL6_00210 [Bacteriovoracaceae bacterium]